MVNRFTNSPQCTKNYNMNGTGFRKALNIIKHDIEKNQIMATTYTPTLYPWFRVLDFNRIS